MERECYYLPCYKCLKSLPYIWGLQSFLICFFTLIHYSMNYNLKRPSKKPLLLTYQMQALYLKLGLLSVCCCLPHLQRSRPSDKSLPTCLPPPDQDDFPFLPISCSLLWEFCLELLKEYSLILKPCLNILLSLCSFSTYVPFVLYQFALVTVLLCKKVLQLLHVYVLLSRIRL